MFCSDDDFKAMANTTIGLEVQQQVRKDPIASVRIRHKVWISVATISLLRPEILRAFQVAANTSCLAITFSLSELVNHLDLGVSAAVQTVIQLKSKRPLVFAARFLDRARSMHQCSTTSAKEFPLRRTICGCGSGKTPSCPTGCA